MNNGLLKTEWEILRERLKSEKEVLKELEKHYSAALEDIDQRIASMLGRNDANLPHVIRRIEYQRMIKAQIQAALDKLHANEYETISAYLNDSYTNGFVGTMYTLHEQDLPIIIPIDQNAVVKAVTIDSKLKHDLYKTLGVDMNKLKKTVASEITRGIASGLMYADIARNIKNASGIPFRRARTIVRTEAGRVQEQAAMDAGNKAKQAGADVVKQWSAIRDGKTRPHHRLLDRQVREMDERFSNGLMFPQEPGGKAEEVINCRCTTLIRAREEMDEDELRIMQERASYHGLLVKDSKEFGKAKAKDFSDFKKKYLKAAETVEKQGVSVYNSGGLFGAYNDQNDPNNEKREAHAELYYKELRNSKKQYFVDAVSKNASIDAETVSKAYKHVFEDKHELDNGLAYFDPDYYMAESFRRLRTNDNIQEHDKVLLRHEALEYDIMQENPDMSYEEAHEMAAKVHNYKKALLNWLKKEGK